MRRPPKVVVPKNGSFCSSFAFLSDSITFSLGRRVNWSVLGEMVCVGVNELPQNLQNFASGNVSFPHFEQNKTLLFVSIFAVEVSTFEFEAGVYCLHS